MSSSLTYTFTKLRSLPCSLYRCALRPLCLRVRSARSSPTVAPDASTVSCLSVYGRSGVGIRIFAMVEAALFEGRSIVFEIPDRHVASLRAVLERRARRRSASARQGGVGVDDGDDDVREGRPRMIQVVLRRPRRMVRVRVIEPQELGAHFAGASLGEPIIRRPHQEAATPTLLGRVR